MAAKGKLGGLRAALAEERERLGKVLDQIDETLDCLEPGTHRASAEQVTPRLPERAVSTPEMVGSSDQQENHLQVASSSFRFFQQTSKPLSQSSPMAWESVAKSPAKPLVARAITHQLDAARLASPKPPWTPADGVKDKATAPLKSRNTAMGVGGRGASVVTTDLKTRRSTTKPLQGDRQARRIFANADQMKEQVQQAILEPDYDVRDMYKSEGCFQAVARSQIFDVSCLSMIILNALWLAVETDYNDEALLVNADTSFIVVENVFCTFFCSELFVRFMAFRVKADTLRDSWFIFDCVLVSFMAFETWILSLLVWITDGAFGASGGSTSILRVVRLFRMTRAARVARVLKAVPELLVIGRGIVIVARTVVVIMCLLALVVYTCAIVFTQLAKGTDLEKNVHPNAKCSDMVTTMSTLLLGGILPDFAPTTEDFAAEDFFFAAFFFMFILLAYVTIMNMLIGVLVEVVAVVASVEKETNQVAAVKRVLLKWTPDTDLDGDCRIGVDEFKNMLNNDGCAKDLNDVGVDAIALIDHADFVFRNKDALTFSELLTVVLGLRGRNDTKVQDLVQMRKFLHVEMQRIEASLESLHVSLVGESSRPDDVKTGKSFGNLQHEASVVTRDTTTYRSDVIVRNSELSEAILDADQTIELMESEAPVQRPVDDDEVTPIDPKADW